MTLAYLEGGARGLDKNKSGFFEMMLARIERFQVIRDMDEEQLESAFFNYHLEAARKEEEETRAARLMRNWLENTTPVGRQAAHRRVIENLESMADAMRLKKASKALSETQRKKLEKSRFLDGLIEELWADHETLPAVDTVLTHAPKPLGKPAFRIAMPRKDS
jgi:uncharacterized membrane protein